VAQAGAATAFVNHNENTGWSRRRLLSALAAIFIAANTASALAQTRPAEAPLRIQIQAQPVEGFDLRDASRRVFGTLEFRGGLVLTAANKNFGGISGLRVAADGGRFIAVTDRGYWLRGRIVYEGARPAGIADAELAPQLGPDGKPLTLRGWYDSESLAQDGGTLYVGLERVHQIVRFDYGKDGVLARGRPIAVPSAFRALPSNRGIEALEAVPKDLPLGGTLIVLTEQALDGAGNHRGFLIGGPSPGEFAIARSKNFDVTDAALSPRGDLFVLERKFSFIEGAGMRLRRLALKDIKPGAVVDGPTLIEADMGYQIDNMEALAVHRADDGALIFTMISDDNFSPIQRILLLQFALRE
jgi:hypothetical protein